MPDQPNILITGAAGRIGKVTADLLHEESYPILATDLRRGKDTPYPFKTTDLTEMEQVKALMEKIDAVVHLANHPGMGDRPPHVTFNENVTMNLNVFQAAAELGARRIIFASTLQVIGSHADTRTVKNLPPPPNYPLDGDTEPTPANTYSLSKTVSEVMLRHYADRCGLDAVAIRYPLIHQHEVEVFVPIADFNRDLLLEGFSFLSINDAASLILAILKSELPGYRVYVPAISDRCADT